MNSDELELMEGLFLGASASWNELCDFDQDANIPGAMPDENVASGVQPFDASESLGGCVSSDSAPASRTTKPRRLIPHSPYEVMSSKSSGNCQSSNYRPPTSVLGCPTNIAQAESGFESGIADAASNEFCDFDQEVSILPGAMPNESAGSCAHPRSASKSTGSSVSSVLAPGSGTTEPQRLIPVTQRDVMSSRSSNNRTPTSDSTSIVQTEGASASIPELLISAADASFQPADLENLPFSACVTDSEDGDSPVRSSVQTSDDEPSSPIISMSIDPRHSLADIKQIRALLAAGLSVNAPIKEERGCIKRGGLERWKNFATAGNTLNPATGNPWHQSRGKLLSSRSLESNTSEPSEPLEIPAAEDADDEFGTLLHFIAADPTLAKSKLLMTELIAAKASVNARSTLGSTPLMRAAEHKHVGVAKILLAHHANPEPTDNLCRSALHHAIQLTDEERFASRSATTETTSRKLVELLLRNKADPNSGIPSMAGHEPSASSSCDVVQLVLRHDTSAPSVAPLLSAIHNCNAPAVSCLLQHGVLPTFLLEAVASACPAIIRELLKAQADPSVLSSEGLPAMELALRRKSEQEAVTNMLRAALAERDKQTIARCSLHKQLRPPGTTSHSELSLPLISMIGAPRRPSFTSVAGSRRPSGSVAGSRRPSFSKQDSRRPSFSSFSEQGSRRPSFSNEQRRPSVSCENKLEQRRPSVSYEQSKGSRRPSLASTNSGSPGLALVASYETGLTSAQLNEERAERPNALDRRCSSLETTDSESMISKGESSFSPGFLRGGTLTPMAEYCQNQREMLSLAVKPRTLQEYFHEKLELVADHIEWTQVILQPLCQDLCESKAFQALMFMVLMAALFIADVWVLLDLNSRQGLDVILLCLLGLFVIEMTVQSIAFTTTYVGSFFFYMDVLGTASILLDVSYTNPFEGHADGQSFVVMRIARLAKLGARAGRFTKLVKLLRFLPGMRQQSKERTNNHKTAHVISNQMITALSTRVSFLILVMVIVLPTFDIERYPQVDQSMRHWANEVSIAVDEKRGSADIMELLEEFDKFFTDLNYFPYQLEAKFPNNTDALSWSFAATPEQSYYAVRIYSDSGRVQAWFDFRSPRRIDAGINVLLIVFVMLLMTGFCLIMSNSVSLIVLQPMEKLLSYLRNATSTIFKSVTDMTNMLMEDEQEEVYGRRESQEERAAVDALGAETELLMKVVQKLATMSEIAMKKRDLKEENNGGVQDLLACCILPEQPDAPKATRNENVSLDRNESTDSMFDQESRMASHQPLLTTVGLDIELLLSWRFNALETNDKQNHVAIYSMLRCQRNRDTKADEQITSNFVAATSAGYNKQVPYHNWAHAVDVVHAVYRFLCLCEAHVFLNRLELFSLLVSAAGHDLGHFGLNNLYLTETSHALALRYNDVSPLENMHCARLFEILRDPKSDVFGGFDKQDQKDARNIIIDSILHTDMIHHNTMVQDLQVLYEMNCVVLTSGDIGQRAEVFSKSKALMRRLFVHAADISNPTKPFTVCRAWANLILNEFFSQGDTEKEAGLPVQMLNDRDKVNRPLSQMGFIEFLVAPLFFVTAQLLPDLQPQAQTCVENAQHWALEWRTTKIPQPCEDEVKGVQERVAKLAARLL